MPHVSAVSSSSRKKCSAAAAVCDRSAGAGVALFRGSIEEKKNQSKTNYLLNRFWWPD